MSNNPPRTTSHDAVTWPGVIVSYMHNVFFGSTCTVNVGTESPATPTTPSATITPTTTIANNGDITKLISSTLSVG
jgi:hypothetical protein